ncbi:MULTISPECIES: LysE family transporter [unclassified Pseudodesulfovibrio]|uniref:LysE family translocator n=1 Tax=unclassified Pseudodesulfovibrio TaxID=2661612 RepID=UPI0019D4DC47|nr:MULTISPECIES: LysE family transporter [unclassified Pseudodesulfovibrio]
MTIGLILGLSAGCSPGPLLTLVIAETLRHGAGAGMKMAISPLFSDLPIILAVLFLLDQLSGLDNILGWISILGGILIVYMGYENMRTRPVCVDYSQAASVPLFKGILVNMFSPHPYLFWVSVGAPIIHKAMSRSVWAFVGFICCFYMSLVGSKIILALIVGRSRSFITGKSYIWIMRVLGMTLCLLALILVEDGFKRLGWMP